MREIIATTMLPSRQRGATLLVGLIMVLLMTIIGLAAIRGSGLQEQMAGNMRDRHVGFEAAEAALREGESFLANGGVAVLPKIDKDLGFYSSFDQPGSHYWLGLGSAPFNWDTQSASYSGSLSHVSEQPQYVVEEVEFLEPGIDGSAAGWQDLQNQEPKIMFRVTSRALGGNENTVVVLQSTYR